MGGGILRMLLIHRDAQSGGMGILPMNMIVRPTAHGQDAHATSLTSSNLKMRPGWQS
jgi:hypothetical protein